MRTKTLVAGLAAGLVLLAAACGNGESASSDADGDIRNIDVSMVDIDFKPETLEVDEGEEVRFRFSNDGKIRHEAYIGTVDDQADHAKEMAEATADDDGHGHDDSRVGDDKITLEPGKSGELTYRFDEAGTYEIGCHEPGHYAGGMKITVNVS